MRPETYGRYYEQSGSCGGAQAQPQAPPTGMVCIVVPAPYAVALQSYVQERYGYMPSVRALADTPSIKAVDNRVDMLVHRVAGIEQNFAEIASRRLERTAKLERQIETLLQSYERAPELIDSIRNA